MAINHSQLIGRLEVAQGKDLLKRGLRVQARARQLISGAGVGHPKRVDTGQTRSSIQVQLRKSSLGPYVRVGSGLRKARWIHDGTGLYGPRRAVIRPRSAKVLAFKSKKFTGKKNGMVFARYVRGMKPNPFLKKALPAAKLG